MADKEPATKKKRVVKNPETFRERASKAAETEGSSGAGRRASSAVKRGTKTAVSPVGRFFKRIGQSKGFKPFRKPLRMLGRLLAPQYIRDSWRELKLVSWPDWNTSRRLTIAVLIFAAVFGLSVAGIDYVIDKIFRAMLDLN